MSILSAESGSISTYLVLKLESLNLICWFLSPPGVEEAPKTFLCFYSVSLGDISLYEILLLLFVHLVVFWLLSISKQAGWLIFFIGFGLSAGLVMDLSWLDANFYGYAISTSYSGGFSQEVCWWCATCGFLDLVLVSMQKV